MEHQRKATPRFSTDKIAKQLSISLIEDFRSSLDPVVYDALVIAAKSKSITAFRECVEAMKPDEQDEPYTFKVKAQLANLYKKYTFETDVYTPSQVTQMSVDKFMDNQRRLSAFVLDDSSNVTKSVIMFAKGWIEGVLKDFDEEEFLFHCDFARKSTVGIPLRDACYAERWKVPLTGSEAHIAWFQHRYLVWNSRPRKYLEDQCGGDLSTAYRAIESLDAVLVPKTFKSRRMIMANSTIGSLYSNGLGKVLTARLLAVGYNIKNLQKIHGELARVGSVKLNLTTADQSLASDNITVQLIDRLLPVRWANALKLGRISKIRLAGSTVETTTFSTMGIGFTFPLQTLVFLALLKGISLEFFHKNLQVSAYGDDLIYDSRLHPFVSEIFPKLGLVINEDKTYAFGSFRESCGSDYFRGLDVRPFQLGMSDSGSQLTRRKYEAFLYTIINGLRRRWTDQEVLGTLNVLGSHMVAVGIRPYVIPRDYPADGGVHADHPFEPLMFLTNQRDPKGGRHGIVTFQYLRFFANTRKETRHEPYLWWCLQQLSAANKSLGRDSEGPVGTFSYIMPRDCSNAIFEEEIAVPQPPGYRSELTGKRVRKKDTLIAVMQRGRYRVQYGSSSFWT
jgi:hypothetical protein